MKVSLPNNLRELVNFAGIGLYTFRMPNDNLFSISVDDLLDKVPNLRGQVETIHTIIWKGIFDRTILAIAFKGFVGSKKISGKFVTFQNSDNLRIFATLMKATGRFVEVRNTDWHLVDFRSGWVSSRDRVGHVFGNFLASLHEFGIYSYWINRYQKFSDSTSVHNLREDILLKYNASLKRMRVRKDVPFSWAQVEMHFALFAIGLGAACIAQLSEHVWKLMTDAISENVIHRSINT